MTQLTYEQGKRDGRREGRKEVLQIVLDWGGPNAPPAGKFQKKYNATDNEELEDVIVRYLEMEE